MVTSSETTALLREEEHEASRYRATIVNLNRAWDRVPSVATIPADQGVLAHVLLGLLAHVQRGAQAVLLLDAQGMVREAVPIARKMYEFSVTGMWISSVGGAALAGWTDRSVGQSKKLADAVKRHAKWPVPQNAEDFYREFEARAGKEYNVAGSFESICQQFAAGNHLYVMYRLLSGECHPNNDGVAFMLAEDPRFDEQAWQLPALLVTAQSVLWTIAGLNELWGDRSLTEALATAGEVLGAAPRLPLK